MSSGGGPSPRKMKKVSFEGEESGEEGGLDAVTQKALEEIDSAQNEIDALSEQSSEEILKIEQTYNKLKKPFYDKRNESISKIPNFWVTAMINHPQLSLLIDEEREDCLQFIKTLEVEEFEDIKSGFRLKFHFLENPYFTNECLVKEIFLMGEETPRSTSTAIMWKDGMDLSKISVQETGNLKRKRGYDPKDFFAWFSDHEDPAADDIAEVIKDDLWPNPLQYYLAPEDEGNGIEEGDEGSDEGDDGVIVEGEEDEDLDGEGEDEVIETLGGSDDEPAEEGEEEDDV